MNKLVTCIHTKTKNQRWARANLGSLYMYTFCENSKIRRKKNDKKEAINVSLMEIAKQHALVCGFYFFCSMCIFACAVSFNVKCDRWLRPDKMDFSRFRFSLLAAKTKNSSNMPRIPNDATIAERTGSFTFLLQAHHRRITNIPELFVRGELMRSLH